MSVHFARYFKAAEVYQEGATDFFAQNGFLDVHDQASLAAVKAQHVDVYQAYAVTNDNDLKGVVTADYYRRGAQVNILDSAIMLKSLTMRRHQRLGYQTDTSVGGPWFGTGGIPARRKERRSHAELYSDRLLELTLSLFMPQDPSLQMVNHIRVF